jgi:hypothetical protein
MACAHCGKEFVRPPRPTTRYVAFITISEILGIVLFFGALVVFIYLQLP